MEDYVKGKSIHIDLDKLPDNGIYADITFVTYKGQSEECILKRHFLRKAYYFEVTPFKFKFFCFASRAEKVEIRKTLIGVKVYKGNLLFMGMKQGIIINGGAGAGKEYKRKEVAFDKDRIEKLITPENKKDNGYYSEEYGFMSVESIEELKKIQAELKKEGISCTLLETEVFWSSFCQETRYASWIEFSDFENTLDDESKKYAKSFFFE